MAEMNSSSSSSSSSSSARSWPEELASLLDDGAARYGSDPFDRRRKAAGFESAAFDESARSESLRDQAREFLRAWGEMLWELGKGFKDIVRQSLITEDSFVVRKVGKPCAEVSGRLKFLNEYLPEDRDPALAWPVILFVFMLALAALSVNMTNDSFAPHVKKVQKHPSSAIRVQLPDGRHIAYGEQGVPADRARFTIVIPHSFLFSRLAGIPGIKVSLLEEFGVRLVTYDLPGFGESDPHPERNLNSSALDMSYLANSVDATDKFWVLCFSSACMHAWATLRYIPDRVAGVAMVAPMINPYEPRMTKDESSRTWAKWVQRRKLTYGLARRFPKLLSVLFRRKFFSGIHGSISDWLSLSMAKKDEALIQQPQFEEFWHRNVEESIRQGDISPFTEEYVLQVSKWSFSLADLQVQKKCQHKGILPWLKSMYSQADCELTGYLGPIHLWQGMDDEVVPPPMADCISRLVPQATIHRLPDEGHFSFFFFCDECHRQVFSTLFGVPQGPLDKKADVAIIKEPLIANPALE
ncbi:uncharacterized protein LOC115672265 [Syzygium oleosum]|uniref:uncharacterized protein LOC115672265 n=1 Tax=Syzygium oleosum TaxID=219896 RepID=UPI0011D1CAA4|nr:uncharacterized protein LOC115672265 [Syzygium oleosum]